MEICRWPCWYESVAQEPWRWPWLRRPFVGMTQAGKKSRELNWNAISALGQLLSGVAVTVTLIYLTVQVRYAKVAASDVNRLARSNGVVNYLLAEAHEVDFRRSSLKLGKNRELIDEVARRFEISEDDATQLHSTALYWFWLHWGQWSTTTEDRDRLELRQLIQRFYRIPHIRMVWEAKIGRPGPPFSDFVDEALAEADAEPALSTFDLVALRAKMDALGVGLPFESKELRPGQGGRGK